MSSRFIGLSDGEFPKSPQWFWTFYGLVGFLLVIKRLPRPAIPDVCYRHLDVERPSQRWGCFPLSPLFSSWFVFLFLEEAEFSVSCKCFPNYLFPQYGICFVKAALPCFFGWF